MREEYPDPARALLEGAVEPESPPEPQEQSRQKSKMQWELDPAGLRGPSKKPEEEPLESSKQKDKTV